MSIELKVGEWYETRLGIRVRVIADLREWGIDKTEYPFLAAYSEGTVSGYTAGGAFLIEDIHNDDITKHLPGCTGWDWVEPKPEKWRDATPEDAIREPHLRCKARYWLNDSPPIYGVLVGYYMSCGTPTWVVDLAGETLDFQCCQVLDTENE